MAYKDKKEKQEMPENYFQYLYKLPPTDWFEGFLHFGEYMERAGMQMRYNEGMTQAFGLLDLLDEAFYIAFGVPHGSSLSVQKTFDLVAGPYISAIPGIDGNFSLLLITFKISNNGITYLLSPIEIPKFAEWEEDFTKRRLEIRNGALNSERNDLFGEVLPGVLDESVVYFLQSEIGPIKIGTAIKRNLKKRLSTLQDSLHYKLGKLTLIGLMHGSYKEEKELHKRFEKSRYFKEWFAPRPELINFIKNLPGIKWKMTEKTEKLEEF